MGGPPPPHTPPQPLHKAGPRGSLGVRPGVRGYGRANNGGKAAQGQGGPYNLGGGTWGRLMRGPLLSSWGNPGSKHDPLDSSQKQARGFPQSPCWRGTSPHPDLSECQGGVRRSRGERKSADQAPTSGRGPESRGWGGWAGVPRRGFRVGRGVCGGPSA